MAQTKRKAADASGRLPRKKARPRQPIGSVTTRAATKRNLSNAVFLTTELLENILGFLPMKDLLLSQRVCRKWQLVITASKALQQALYFTPADHAFYSKQPSAAEEAKGTVFRSGQLNPLFLHICPFPSQCERARHEARDKAYALFKFLCRPSTEYANASWRKMLLVQPPVTEMEGTVIPKTVYTWHPRVTSCVRFRPKMFEISKSEGLTTGHVAEILIAAEENAGPVDRKESWLTTVGVLLGTEEDLDLNKTDSVSATD